MMYVKSKTKDIVDNPQELREIVTSTLSRMAAVAGRTLGPGGAVTLIEREGMPPRTPC